MLEAGENNPTPTLMTRDLYIRTKTGVRRYPLKKTSGALTILNHGLYRTDDRLMRRDTADNHSFIVYHADALQPYFLDEVVDPDETMALAILAAKSKNGISKVGLLNGLNPNWLLYGIIGLLVVYALLTGGIV